MGAPDRGFDVQSAVEKEVDHPRRNGLGHSQVLAGDGTSQVKQVALLAISDCQKRRLRVQQLLSGLQVEGVDRFDDCRL